MTDADLHWPWSSEPRYKAGATYTTVDPFPCYAHNTADVEETLRLVEKACPLPLPPTVYILSHESPSRTNGWCESKTEWSDEEDAWVPAPAQIVLAGKRIPPHPAVTRYLVSHEYGHAVEYALLTARGVEQYDETIRDEYAELRGIEKPDYYGGRTWHACPGELIANDFRCLVAKVETEFWPHAGFAHPATMPAVQQWWDAALGEL